MFDNLVAVLGAFGALATAGVLIVALVQFKAAKQDARTTFEDSLSREYRRIVGQLPAEAFYVNGERSHLTRLRGGLCIGTSTSAMSSSFS